jgi:hypothetical protein
MATYLDLADANDADELHVQVRLPGPDAWSHHPITSVEYRDQPDGSRRLVLVSDPPTGELAPAGTPAPV